MPRSKGFAYLTDLELASRLSGVRAYLHSARGHRDFYERQAGTALDEMHELQAEQHARTQPQTDREERDRAAR